MPHQFFIPYNPPNKWTLLDVLFWVSCEKMPIAKFDSEGNEYRESAEILMEHYDWFGETCRGDLTKNDLVRLKIDTPDPSKHERDKIEELQKHFSKKDDFVDLLKKSKGDEKLLNKLKPRYKALRAETIDYRRRFAKKKTDNLDIWKAKLLITVREGRLHAEGIKVPDGIDLRIDRSEIFETQNSISDSFTQIPKEAWISTMIAWENCILQFDHLSFSQSDLI